MSSLISDEHKKDVEEKILEMILLKNTLSEHKSQVFCKNCGYFICCCKEVQQK
jgi:hypothetical protein